MDNSNDVPLAVFVESNDPNVVEATESKAKEYHLSTALFQRNGFTEEEALTMIRNLGAELDGIATSVPETRRNHLTVAEEGLHQEALNTKIGQAMARAGQCSEDERLVLNHLWRLVFNPEITNTARKLLKSLSPSALEMMDIVLLTHFAGGFKLPVLPAHRQIERCFGCNEQVKVYTKAVLSYGLVRMGAPWKCCVMHSEVETNPSYTGNKCILPAGSRGLPCALLCLTVCFPLIVCVNFAECQEHKDVMSRDRTNAPSNPWPPCRCQYQECDSVEEYAGDAPAWPTLVTAVNQCEADVVSDIFLAEVKAVFSWNYL